MYVEQILDNINMLSRQIKRQLDSKVVKYGITGVQGRLINYIYRNSQKHDVFAKDIEKHFDITGASIAGILQNMEKNELIKRETVGNDARLRRIVLTNKALELRKELEKNSKELEKQATKGITKEEMKTYVELTKKMSANLEKRRG